MRVLRAHALVLSLTLTATMLPLSRSSAECTDYPSYLHWVGWSGTTGTNIALTVAGQYAYVAQICYGLSVVDLSVPEHPQVTGWVWNYDPDCSGVAVSGGFAYMTGSDPDLMIIDVRDASHPIIVERADLPAPARGIAIPGEGGGSGTHAYIAASEAGLLVVDISTIHPSCDRVVGRVDLPGAAQGIAVSDALAYVAEDSGGLDVVDVSDPRNPHVLGRAATSGVGGRVALDGGYAYVAEGESGVDVIDILDPAHPVKVASIVPGQTCNGITVSGHHAFVAGWGTGGGLMAIDIGDPTSPRLVGEVSLSGDVGSDVAVFGGHAYVACYYPYFDVIDVTNPESPPLLCTLDTPGSARDVAVAGGIAYVADGPKGLEVVEVESVPHPEIVGHLDTPGEASGVAAQGTIVLLADGETGLHVVDAADPTAPSIIGFVDTPGSATDVVVSGSYAYIADGASGLQIADLSDPAAPYLVGSLDTPRNAVALVVRDSYAYVADDAYPWHDGRLSVIDVSNPHNPTLAGWVGAEFAHGVAVLGKYAYVGDNGVFRVIDISDPHNPFEVTWLIMGSAHGVAASGTTIYLADSGRGLKVIDAGNPPDVRVAGSRMLPASPREVAVSDEYVFVAGGESGIHILPRQCEAAGVRASPVDLPVRGLTVLPNPTREGATVDLMLRRPGIVRMSLHDPTGRVIRRMDEGIFGAGRRTVAWNGRDDGGRPVGAGAYWVRVEVGGEVRTARFVVVR